MAWVFMGLWSHREGRRKEQDSCTHGVGVSGSLEQQERLEEGTEQLYHGFVVSGYLEP